MKHDEIVHEIYNVTHNPTKLSQDPGLWCNEAFQTADVVLIVASPIVSMQSNVAIVYQNLDNFFLRLLKENYPQRNKRYYAVLLPYCKYDDIPEEARLFRKYCLPEDVMRLVEIIHGVKYIRFLMAPDNELLESIRHATKRIYKDTLICNMGEMDNLEQLLG